MSAMKWNEDQIRAIKGQGNLIVSAAAGSGKTAVLTERLCRLVYAGTPVDHLLVVTFTRAAAQEMKGRIAKKLKAFSRGEDLPEELKATLDDDKKTYLRRQAEAVGGACISTNHAFCARVLRRHGHLMEPALSPTFCILDEMETPAVLERVRTALFNGYGEEDNADYRRLLKCFSTEEGVFDAVKRVDAFLASEPDPEGWLLDAVGRYVDDAWVEKYLAERFQGLRDGVLKALKTYRQVLDEVPSAWPKVKDVISSDITTGLTLELCDSYDSLRETIGIIKATAPSMRFPKGVPDEEKAYFKEARQAYKDAVAAALKAMPRTADGEKVILREAGEMLSALAHVVTDFRALFRREKDALGAIDYTDLEHMTLRLLANEAVAGEYREKFAYIAVDEYQDSNRVQDAIIARIAREDNLFFVGDVKQSIYRFRLADPAMFVRRCDSFAEGEGQEIPLKFNFRSARDVLEAINDVFDRIMTGETSCGMIDYAAHHRLEAGRADLMEETDTTEIYLIGKKPVEGETQQAEEPEGEPLEDEPASDEDGDGEHGPRPAGDGEETVSAEDLADAEVEARQAALCIHGLMEGNMTVHERDKGERPVSYRDIAILFRSRERAEVTARVLAQAGIPCYAQTGGGYFATIEVMLALNILRVIDNPRQDIPLISVLYSVVGGFSTEELATLRIHYRTRRPSGEAGRQEDGFYRSYFAACAHPGEDPVALRCAAFHKRVEAWREDAAELPVGTLLSRILEESGLYDEMGVLPGGAQRQNNLDALIDEAYAFEKGQERGISAFLRFMDHAGKSNASIGAAQAVGADVVKIMTIHKSKGLEFPVVLMMGMGKPFNLRDTAEMLCLHHEHGIGLRYTMDGVKHDTIVRQLVASAIRSESLAEEMRVLYVGMTRAEQRLIMIGCVKDIHAKAEPLVEPPTADAVNKAKCMMDWVLMGARNHVRVNTVERNLLLGSATALETGAEEPIGAVRLATLVEGLTRQLSWRYPHEVAIHTPAKVGVSTALRGQRVDSVSFETPAFARGAAEGAKGPSALERGTAVHAVLEALEKHPMDAGAVRAVAERLKDRGILTEEMLTILPYEEMAWYTGTALYARACGSSRCERELPFAIRVPADRLYPEMAGETGETPTVMLQGIMDCCFVEDGGWILLDYKTDRPREGVSATEMAEEHRAQLTLYAEALEKLTGLSVREMHVVLLSVEKTVRL